MTARERWPYLLIAVMAAVVVSYAVENGDAAETVAGVVTGAVSLIVFLFGGLFND